MKDFGKLDLRPGEGLKHRKICDFPAVMSNAEGTRFVDEGINIRNDTCARFAADIVRQARHFLSQIFDTKACGLPDWRVSCP